jgi:Protein of unknown function, DUF547
MSPVRLLNPARHEPSLAPTELSEALIDQAQEITRPEECARLGPLVGQLHRIRPERIDGDAARIAFWVNLYNTLVRHRLCMKPVRGSLLMHPRLFGTVAYDVGGEPYSPNLIEHGLLRGNRRPPFHLRRPLRDADPRLAGAPSRLDPRIHFALNCGARSCPPIRHYAPRELDDQLELATRAYLEQEVSVVECRVTLPRLMRLYRADFGRREPQLEFAAARVPEVEACLRGQREQVRVGYGRFDWNAALEHQ